MKELHRTRKVTLPPSLVGVSTSPKLSPVALPGMPEYLFGIAAFGTTPGWGSVSCFPRRMSSAPCIPSCRLAPRAKASSAPCPRSWSQPVALPSLENLEPSLVPGTISRLCGCRYLCFEIHKQTHTHTLSQKVLAASKSHITVLK